MQNQYEFADTISFTASEFALGRQRCRKWVSLITQQLRLRHIYQIYAYNILEEKKSTYYFTLHNTPLSSPFYTSEKITGKHPKWNELLFGSSIDTSVSSVVIRVWKSTKKEDTILLTWGVNFSGLVYLGNKISDLQPKYFKANTVIFFMQGVYFTSHEYIRGDFNGALPFHKNLNLIETSENKQVLYRRVAVRVPKGEVTSSYTLEKLRRLQELQRQIRNKKHDVQNIKQKIKSSTERESKQDDSQASRYSNNIRFAPQLLTMNSLNKMLHEKPTRAERETMTRISKKIEVFRLRLRLLNQERDRMSVNVKKLKQKESKLSDENDEKNSNLMSLYHTLSKESHQWDNYKHSLPRQKELLIVVSEQLHRRQMELLKELLFIYPIDKLPNENKYLMLGIYLPDSELLLDYQDPGVSVVLGYICHILLMCSIFLQIPLRHPMRHFGSRSTIYNQSIPDILDKDREFPLYTKGRDRAHFSYAVFLLNKNINQLTWDMHHKLTIALKETLKHLRSLLLGEDVSEYRYMYGYLPPEKMNPDLEASSTAHTNSIISLDKLVSPSISSLSSCNLNDPLLDRFQEKIRKERCVLEEPTTTSPNKKREKLSIFRSTTPKRGKKEKASKSSSEVLAVPEAYLNRQISKDLFHRCASSEHRLGETETIITIRQGVEEIRANVDPNEALSDSIEEGTDPLDPSTNLDSLITKSIDITSSRPTDNTRISRSMDSYVDDEASTSSLYKTCELGSNPTLNSCDKTGNSGGTSEVKVSDQQRMLEQWLAGDTSLLASGELVFSEEYLRMSLQDITSPLTERTDRLLSNNQPFNLVKHRPVE